MDEELHRHAAGSIARADALLFGRVTYIGHAEIRLREAALWTAADDLVRPHMNKPLPVEMLVQSQP